jgi:hypothetical protein
LIGFYTAEGILRGSSKEKLLFIYKTADGILSLLMGLMALILFHKTTFVRMAGGGRLYRAVSIQQHP